MSKKHMSIHKDIKVVELDTDKQYAIIFPDYTSKEDFEYGVKAIRDIGVEKFISVHKASDAKLMRADVKKDNFITRWLTWRKFKKMSSSTTHNNDTEPTYTPAE